MRTMRKLINLVEGMENQHHVDINSVVKDLTFVPTTKKPTPYKHVEVDSTGYYRIARQEFEATYQTP